MRLPQIFFALLTSIGVAWLGLYAARGLKKALATGVAGTMHGRIYRKTQPVAFSLLVIVNVFLIAMCFSFPLIIAATLILLRWSPPTRRSHNKAVSPSAGEDVRRATFRVKELFPELENQGLDVSSRVRQLRQADPTEGRPGPLPTMCHLWA